MQKILSFVFSLVPSNNRLLYHICERYIDRFNNDAESRMDRNGEFYFLEQLGSQFQIAFDVGANIGEWTKYALRCNPQMQIHLFEPSHKTFHNLLKNDFPETVICNNIGLSSKSGSAILHILSDNAGVNSLHDRQWSANKIEPTRWTSQETVQLDTLDSYCKKQGVNTIDLLKIDVEGHELEVLRGSYEMLEKRSIRIIQFEYNYSFIGARVFLKDIFEYLQNFGFTLHKLYPQALREYPAYHPGLESFKYSNWIATLEKLDYLYY